ncbi:hypothetical protein ACJMK2_027249 [Sinanodonta woodiana]|uniref:Uncharacterized protein n=1 Tax=Sinanodonta woodiana TaxID=1069815 RepID=A0ABD3XMJ8_SINWO
MPKIIDLTYEQVQNVKFEHGDSDSNRNMIKEIDIGKVDVHELQTSHTCDVLTIFYPLSSGDNPVNVCVQTKYDDHSIVELNKNEILAVLINRKNNVFIDFGGLEINYIKGNKRRARIAELIGKIDLKNTISNRNRLIMRQDTERVRLSRENMELKNRLSRYERYNRLFDPDTDSGCEDGFDSEEDID